MSNITPDHVRAFQGIFTGAFGEATLASCTLNGEPAVAIVAVQQVGEGKIAVCPLFVAIAPSMKIIFDGEGGGDDEDAPERSAPRGRGLRHHARHPHPA